MSILIHAKNELEAIRPNPSDDPENNLDYEYAIEVENNVLELLEVFTKQGHSGYSASIVSSLFNRLVEYKPLSPLTGEDSEWINVTDMTANGEVLFQNKRNGSVFKSIQQDGTSRAYDIDGVVFWEWFRTDEGEVVKTYFTSIDSRVNVIFPYTTPAKPEYRFRPSEEFPDEVRA